MANTANTGAVSSVQFPVSNFAPDQDTPSGTRLSTESCPRCAVPVIRTPPGCMFGSERREYASRVWAHCRLAGRRVCRDPQSCTAPPVGLPTAAPVRRPPEERKLPVDIVTADMFDSLINVQAAPAVSIYLPTHRVGPEIQQDPIRLRNLLQDARGRLAAEGMRGPEADALLRPVA